MKKLSLLLVKYFLLVGLLMPASLGFGFSNIEDPEDVVRVKIENVSVGDGIVMIALYEESHFLELGKEIMTFEVKANDGIIFIEIPVDQLQLGQYALAAYQDANSNGKLDKNLVGVPKESYAFSGSGLSKWKQPTFHDSAFTVTEQIGKTVELYLAKWKEK